MSIRGSNRVNKAVDAMEGVEEDSGSDWQVTYLDTVTILLAFFVILASMADVDMAVMMGSLKPDAIDSEEQFDQPVTPLFYPIESLYAELNGSLEEEIAQRTVQLDKGSYEIRMLFSGSKFYKTGEASLLPQGQSVIARIVEQLAALERQDFKLDIEGHTDSAPIRTLRFNDNWELSSARAANVVRYFLEAGIPADKLKASGYADTFPVVKEKDENNNYIPEGQDRNRRIVIRLYYN